MALVTCPECGRKNVSDSAVACPDCGFGIREYYTNIKEQQQKEEKEKEYREHARSVAQNLDDDIKKHQAKRAELLAQKEAQKTINENQISQETIKESGVEEEQDKKRLIEQCKIEVKKDAQAELITRLKKKRIEFLLLLIVALFLTISALLLIDEMLKIGNGLDLFGFFGVVVGGFMCIGSLGLLKEYDESIKAAEKGLDEYNKLIQQRITAEADAKEKERIKREIEMMNNVPCPVCGSRNTYRIDPVERAVSVKLWGMASSKIGKQYQCRNCKHMW